MNLPVDALVNAPMGALVREGMRSQVQALRSPAMSGRTDSGTRPKTVEVSDVGDVAGLKDVDDVEEPDDPDDLGDPGDVDNLDDVDDHEGDGNGDARRARWAAVGAGALLCLAGLAASLMRLTGSVPVLVPTAYAFGAAVCACGAVLGARGRTRRALWLLIAGTMIMALGDQFD